MPANPLAGYGPTQTIVDTTAILPSIDVSQGPMYTVTLTGTGRTLSFVNPIPGAIVTLKVIQDATGSRTITTYTNVLWASGSAPTLTTAAASIDVLRFTYDAATAKWFAETVGKAYS